MDTKYDLKLKFTFIHPITNIRSTNTIFTYEIFRYDSSDLKPSFSICSIDWINFLIGIIKFLFEYWLNLFVFVYKTWRKRREIDKMRKKEKKVKKKKKMEKKKKEIRICRKNLKFQVSLVKCKNLFVYWIWNGVEKKMGARKTVANSSTDLYFAVLEKKWIIWREKWVKNR